MTKGITLDKKIIAAIGAFMFVSPNLNVIESILMYCGLDDHGTVRIIAIGFFALMDLLLGIIFLKAKPHIRYYLILIIFNVLYILPSVIDKDFTSVLQYIMFLLPVTIFAVMMAGDDDIKELFFRYMRVAAKILFVLAVVYIILQYVGTNRDSRGILMIHNMSYGDMGYLFLTGFVMAAIDCKERKFATGLIGMIVFALAVFYSGTRSAILCVAFTVFLWIVFTLFNPNTPRKEKRGLIAGVTILIVSLVVGFFIVPSGSRINDFSSEYSSSFIYILLPELQSEKRNDITVIYVPTNTEMSISDLYEDEIVKRETTKYETEEILHNDVINGENKIIALKNEEDREIAEKYTLFKQYRGFLWMTAYKEFKKSPVIGNGPRYYFNKYDNFFPHNIVLETMSDFGLVGLIVLLGLGIFCFVSAFRHFIKDGDEYYFRLALLLFSHLPRYLLYTTIYSNPTLAFTVLVFLTPKLLKKPEEPLEARGNI